MSAFLMPHSKQSFLLILLILLVSPLQAQLPDPQRFESAIKAFEVQDTLGLPTEGAIVLLGSSSIARWNDASHAALAPLTVVPRGFGGSIMNDALYYLERAALKYKPRAIVLYEGDNDTGMKVPNAVIFNQLGQVIERIHQNLPDTRIYLLAVKPSVLREQIWPVAQTVNKGYQAIAASDSLVYYIDTATPFLQENGKVRTDIFIGDNLHFNEIGNEIWGRTIKAALMPIEAQFEE